jgi:agmatine deiminase
MKNDIHTASRRLPAEWENQYAVQLTLPHEGTDWAEMLDEVLPCFFEIAAAIARFQKVLIVCQHPDQLKARLKPANSSQYIFAVAHSNDTWARDHAGIGVLENNAPVLLDFVFNGWGLKFAADKDNLITQTLHQQGLFRGAIQHGGLVLEGGGIESDGQGTLLTTAACLLSPNRNPHLSAEAIETQLKSLFGLERVLWLHHGYLAGDDTDSHIDTLARFCDPDTIAYVRCTDPEDEHFEELQHMEKELEIFTKLDGTPYNMVALPWPDACYDASGHRLPATYANFLIINKAVLVPLYGVRQDEEALAVFKTLFRNREIIGINCRPLIEQHGSLHCVTMQFPEVFDPNTAE